MSHNATVIPIKGRKLMSVAYYQGGVSIVDFTDLSNIREVAFADLEDATGHRDEWSSYWYNGRIFSNSGLDRRGDAREPRRRRLPAHGLARVGDGKRAKRGATPTRRRRRLAGAVSALTAGVLGRPADRSHDRRIARTAADLPEIATRISASQGTGCGPAGRAP